MSLVLRARSLEVAGFAHGFSLRSGGVSAPPFASLNLGRAVGDAPGDVAENLRRFAQGAGLDLERLFEASQVHGARVRHVRPGEDPAEVRREEADALVATAPGLAVGVRTADCMPLLVADLASGAVAAIHAGWRGLVAGVIAASLEALRACGAAQDLRVAMFPHIRLARFEVSEEVASQLDAAAPGHAVVERSRPKPHVDLAAVARAQLQAWGIAPAQIEDVPGCTLSEPERFFSYRRDGARSGRHLAAIATR